MLGLPLGFLNLEETEKDLRIGVLPVRLTIPNELVVLDLDLGYSVAAPFGLCDLIVDELRPFSTGVGKVRADQTFKGVVLFLAEREDEEYCHTATPATIGAGAQVLASRNAKEFAF